jgi:diguanylate cyclase (GGDEF)-like protein/PAS domain S-box-containing protein
MPLAFVHHMDDPAAAFDGRSGQVEQLNEAWLRTPELLELSGSLRLSSPEENTEKALLAIGGSAQRLRERIRDAVNSGPQTLGVSIAIDGVAQLHQIKLIAVPRETRNARDARHSLVLAWLSMAKPQQRDGDRADMTAALARYGSLITEPWAYVDAAGIYRYVSPQSIGLLGPDATGGLIGLHYAEWAVDRPGRSVGVESIAKALAGETLSYDRLRYDHRFGEERWHRVEMRPDLDGDGKVLGLFIVSQDVQARRNAEAQARSAQNLLDLHLRHGPLIAIELDRDLRILSWSRKAEELFEHAAADVIGRTVREINTVPDIDTIEPRLHEMFSSRDFQSWRHRNSNRTKNGETVWVHWFDSLVTDPVSGQSTLLCLGVDVTQELELKQRLTVAATQDTLTGTLNRKAISLLMSSKLGRGSPFALMLLDLDAFKQINDYRGHPTGDQLLVAFATRMRGLLEPGERLARLGGDEFAVLLDMAQHPSDKALIARAEVFLRYLAAPVRIDFEFSVTASAGIAKSSDGVIDVEALFQKADQAMYRAKAEGGNRVAMYTQSIGEAARARLEMCEALRIAVREQSIDVHYQPIFDTQSDRIVGAEALARWGREGIDAVEPSVFVGLAEEKGFIHELWQCVMRKACLFSASINGVGAVEPCPISVNVSPLQLSDRQFDLHVLSILKETRCLPSWIALEVTESAKLGDDAAVITLHKLTAMGVRCSVDDFGTGYSNFGHLKRLPIATLKVDKSFVRDMSMGETSIVQSMVVMAQSLGLKVVAEGVEFVEELVALKAIGCDLYQGFVASAPIASKDFDAMLANDRMQRAAAA